MRRRILDMLGVAIVLMALPLVVIASLGSTFLLASCAAGNWSCPRLQTVLGIGDEYTMAFSVSMTAIISVISLSLWLFISRSIFTLPISVRGQEFLSGVWLSRSVALRRASVTFIWLGIAVGIAYDAYGQWQNHGGELISAVAAHVVTLILVMALGIRSVIAIR